MTDQTTDPTVTQDPDRDGIILHLPEITYLDTQTWAVDVGLTTEGLAALRKLLGAPAVPSADQAALRERVADVLAADDGWTWVPSFDKTQSPAYRGFLTLADKVLAVLPATTNHDTDTSVTPPPALTEEGRLRARVQVLEEDAERDQGLAATGARCLLRGHQGLIESGRVVIEGHRFALSTKLGLGTDASWDAIHERVAELRRVADETAATETQADSATLLALVRDFLDPGPCTFDHHGYCQAHAAGFGGEPMSCPHGRAKKLLAELESPAVGARQDGAQQQVVSCSHDPERHGPEAGCIECQCTSTTGHETERQDGAQPGGAA